MTGSVKEERDGRVIVETEAEQGGKRIIRNARGRARAVATIGAWQ